MALNRSRYVKRDYSAGSQEAISMGVSLGQICDVDLLEALLNHVSALNEFGGEIFIGANRRKLAQAGDQLIMVDVSEPGRFTTLGYVVAWNSRAQIRGVVDASEEPNEAYGERVAVPDESEPLDFPEEPVENGAGDLEAAEALRAGD